MLLMYVDRDAYKGKVGKSQADELVDEFYVQQNLSCNRVVCTPYLLEVYKRVYRSEESTVKPSSSLRYEFGHSI